MHVGDSCWWYVCDMWVKEIMQSDHHRVMAQALKPATYEYGLRGFVKINGLHLFPINSSYVYGDTGEIQNRRKASGSQYSSVGWSFEGKNIWCMYLVCGSFLHALFLPRCNDSSRSFSTWCPETVPTNSFKATVMRLKLSGSLTNRSLINSTIISGWQDVCQASQHRISDVQR